MKAFLLSLHVIAAIVCIGPVTVAASMFPPRARSALTGGGPGRRAPGLPAEPVLPWNGAGALGVLGVLGLLHRITRVYSVAGLTVPVLGVATAVAMGVMAQAWVIASLLVTMLAAGLLAFAVVPGQRYVITALTEGDGAGLPARATATARRLSMTTGLFSLLWAVVVVLMIMRPGSTTGV